MTYEEFKNQYSVRLNQQQDEAVRQTEGPVLLLAVPGSGKTTVLVTRLGYMLYCKGIRPERILTVTYTVAATRDMKARFVSFFGEDHADKLTFRTINGLCAVVIGYYARQKGTDAFALLDDERQINSVIRDLLIRTGTAFPSDIQVKDARTNITYCKNMMLSESDIHAHKVDGMDFPRVYFEYQDYLLRSRQMDYDDQMVFTYRIFRQYPDILAYFQRRWPYLCVDEAQDTSRIQHAILRLLASSSNNIFMVGDEDQSIYGFRAAWPQALLEFEQVFSGAKVLKLETNYRSTRAIVEKADAFIRRNQNRRPKRMRTENQQGGSIRRIMLEDYSRQYNYLLRIAENCTESTAVLYRNNDSALPLIDLLEQKGIPYACRQRESFFFTSPLVRDITDMLEFAFDDGNAQLFLRFYYKLDLKLKKAVVTRLLYGMPGDKSVFEVLLESGELEPWQVGKVKSMQTHYSKLPYLTSFAAIQRLVRYMGYGDYIQEQHGDSAKLDVLLSLANQTPTVGQFLLHLRELKERIEKLEPRPDCPFVLSTIHASKGLEYDHVILIDAVNGLLPSAEEAGELEEERRLFYVGTTRAKTQLEFLCYENRFGEPADVSFTFISQFLGEATRKQPEPEHRTAPAKPPGPTAEQISAWMKDYIPGTDVTHKIFGRGMVRSRDGNFAVISFWEVGDKKLDLTTCLRMGKIELTHFV
ncbi:MAG: ATP-dependent helicase [Oscillospiraceae bacterium]|nr:ATP-dependent helicase [Oscillospiraceae bacterium]